MSGKALNLVASLLQFSECRGQLKAKWQSHLKKGLSVHREIIVRLVTADAVFDADIVDHHRNHRLVSRQGSGPSRCPLPVGAKYVVEGYGGEKGSLRVIARYVVLPGGRRINVPASLSQPASPAGSPHSAPILSDPRMAHHVR
jgi:hypothetical protein